MATLPRYLTDPIKDDLERKMVFVGGPRQVGKTTLALGLLQAEGPRHPAYLNWDDPQDQLSLMRRDLPGARRCWFWTRFTSFRGGAV